MQRNRLVAPAALALVSVTVAPSAWAQTTGSVAFTPTESALVGTVACNGGPPTAIAPVDASTTNTTGSNDNQASNLSGQACGLPLYTITSTDSATTASDVTSQDDGDGTSTIQQMSLLGGVLTYKSKTESGGCNSSGTSVACSGNAQFGNLVFGGQTITGTYSQPTTFQVTNVSVTVPGTCTGVALFTGTLTLAGTSRSQQGNKGTVSLTPLALNGTLTCIGLPLTSVTVALKDNLDDDLSDFSALIPVDQVLEIVKADMQ